jgi:AI-2 transport protein TqsA
MQKTQTVCLVLLATVAVGVSLALLKTVLLPFIIAVFIAIGCRPIIRYLQQRLNMPRYIAYAAAFLVGLLITTTFAVSVVASIGDLTGNIGVYEERLEHVSKWVVDRLPDSTSTDSKETSLAQVPVPAKEEFEVSPILSESSNSSESPKSPDNSIDSLDEENAKPGVLGEASKNTTRAVTELLEYARSLIESQMLGLAGALTNLLSYGVLVLIFVFFLLVGSKDTVAADSLAKQENSFFAEVEDQIRKYLVLKTVISVATGLAFGFVLWVFDVPLAILFGFLAFLLNFIPNIGPLICAMLPMPLLILNSSMSPWAAGICLALCVAVQFVSGNIVETRVMGESFDVSPVCLLLALMFFGLIWGIVGMFLATPLVSIARIVLAKTKMGKPIAALMAGRLEDIQQLA